MKFDAHVLSDDELVVLESTLRVQLAVAKHVRVQQVTAALGGALLTGGISSLLACPSIVCSTVLRRKCKRRHAACCDELTLRGVALAPVQEVTFAKRALALSIASGLTCCVLGVALDVLVDGAVLEVITFFFSSLVEDHMATTTTAVLQRRAADLVGRDHVYLIDEPPGLWSRDATTAPGAAGLGAAAGAAGTLQQQQGKWSLVDRSRQLWKSASWSFTTQEVQRKVRDAKRAFRHRPSLHDTGTRTDTDADDDDWRTLFAAKSAPNASNQDEEARRRACVTLFGCVVYDATDASEAAARETHVELVPSEAFTLFGDCYVVRARPASEEDRATLLFPRAASPSRRSTWLSATLVRGVPVAHAVGSQDHSVVDEAQRRADRQSIVIAGDDDACAFWDRMWLDDDESDGRVDNYEDGDADLDAIDAIDVSGIVLTHEDAMLSLNRSRVSYSTEPALVVDDEKDDDPFSLFGPSRPTHGASAAYMSPAKTVRSPEPELNDEEGESYTRLFG